MATGKTIDQLVIEIKADTRQLKKDLQQIQGKLKMTGAAGGAAFGSMAGSLSKVKVGALAAVGGIVALGTSIGKVAQVGAGFEDLKDSLDQVFGSISAGDAAMDKVFKFAQTTPFQVETATKAFISLKSAGIEPSMNMLQTFADTASTSVDQLGTFEALIRVVQRSAGGGLGLEELNMIADRGIDVFGGLKDELGLSRDEIATFGKTAEGARKITDALVVSLNKKFGGAMEAKMDNLSTKTSNMVIAFKQLSDDIFKSGLGDFLKDMADSLTSMANSIAKAVRATSGRQTASDFGIEGETPQEVAAALTAERQRVGNLLKQRKEEDPLFDEQAENSRILNLIKLQKEYNRLIELEFVARQNVGIEQLKQESTAKDLSTLLQADIDFMSEFKKLLTDSIPEIDKINEQIKSVEAMRGKLDAKGNLIAKDEEIERVLAFLRSTKNELNDTAQTFQEVLAPAIQSMSLSFTNDFVNALLEGQNALETFRDFSKNIVSQIIATFLQMAVVNKILMSIFGPTGFNVKGFELPTLATGGTIQKGQPTLVGERGAEIFVPNTGGTIMNNMNSKNAMGGQTTVINQSINFATGVVPTVRAEVLQMLPQISDVTKNAVAEAAMKGGAFRRMLQGG